MLQQKKSSQLHNKAAIFMQYKNYIYSERAN